MPHLHLGRRTRIPVAALFLMKSVTIVVPVYNEATVLPELYRRLTETLRLLGVKTQILFVDDGSQDASSAVLAEFESENPDVRVLTLSRNFGHQIAITAGLEHAQGDAVVVMDADLQDPPELISTLIAHWESGFDVVYAVRRVRQRESIGKRLSASLFYRILRMISPVAIPVDTGDFRLMSRRVVDQLSLLPERNRFMRGLVAWVGFRQMGVAYDRAPRANGTTKYPIRKMLRLAGDALFGFSTVPLRFSIAFGMVLSTACFAYGVVAMWGRWVYDRPIHGWTSLMVAIVFVGGVQLVGLGIIGEYIGRIYDEVKQRPLYIVAQRPNGPRA